jgi:hypothetical protein
MFIWKRKPTSETPFVEARKAPALVSIHAGQDDRQASGAAEDVHDAGENDRLGKHVGANPGNGVGAVLGRDRCRVAGV